MTLFELLCKFKTEIKCKCGKPLYGYARINYLSQENTCFRDLLNIKFECECSVGEQFVGEAIFEETAWQFLCDLFGESLSGQIQREENNFEHIWREKTNKNLASIFE